MIYRVFSDFSDNERIVAAKKSWEKYNIKNVAVKDSELSRSVGGLPFLKDLLDIGYNHCENDEDIILYTNSDIGIASNVQTLPSNNFFSVRKNVEHIGEYTVEQLKKISYENTVNCDSFGITKAWYKENRDKIPDFNIGSPHWDLCLLYLLDVERKNNLFYHVKHEAEWKKNPKYAKYAPNMNLFVKFCKEFGIPFHEMEYQSVYNSIKKFMINNRGFEYISRPKFVTYFTPSHQELNTIFSESFYKIYGDNYIIHNISDSQQYCQTATYHDTGWRQTQINKVASLIDLLEIKMTKDNVFIYCDTDILHNRYCVDDIVKKLENYDIVAQNSFSRDPKQKYCSGFFAGKANSKTLGFLKAILLALKSDNQNENVADQYYFNQFSGGLKIAQLNSMYFNPGAVTGGTIIPEGYAEILSSKIPKEVFIVHANWIKGAENKVKFLNYAKKYLATQPQIPFT
jgi:hypothetical protein